MSALLFFCLVALSFAETTEEVTCLPVGSLCNLNLNNGGCSVSDRLACQHISGDVMCESIDDITGTHNSNLFNCSAINPTTNSTYCNSHQILTNDENTQFCSCDAICVEYGNCCSDYETCNWDSNDCTENGEGEDNNEEEIVTEEGSGDEVSGEEDDENDNNDNNSEDMAYLGVGIAIIVLLAILCVVLVSRKEKKWSYSQVRN